MDYLKILAQAGENQAEQTAPITSDQPAEPVTQPPADQQGQAQTKQPAPNGQTPEQQQKRPEGAWLNMVLLVGIFVVFYFVFLRGPRKRQQQQRQMVQSLKKNDRVRTIGGVIGTIVDVKEDEVTLKVDESTNTKVKVVPGAISKNLSVD